ncbi:MAG TPA: FTR1 family protein [Casimicrobiaceae bacterium]|jgi:high-affinity iron transporter
MGNALFIVWRESAEAMLVVGILYAWLKRRPDATIGMRYLWGGVAAGVGLALALAVVMLGVASALSDEALEYFQLAMMLIAAGLIVQMVFWMRRHGRTFKKELEAGMQKKAAAANWWGLLAVVAIAVGRESAETVVFLYGLSAEQQGISRLLVIVPIGLALAFLTFWALQQGGRFLTWRTFFRVSEILLLLLAGALLVSGIEKSIGLGLIPPIVDQLWDSTYLLDDSSRVGGIVAALTGYRARPALLPLTALLAYWIIVSLSLRRRA